VKIYIVLVLNQPFQFTSEQLTHIIALLNSLALHANGFVRLRNLGEAYRVIVSAAAVTNKRGKSYKIAYFLK